MPDSDTGRPRRPLLQHVGLRRYPQGESSAPAAARKQGLTVEEVEEWRSVGDSRSDALDSVSRKSHSAVHCRRRGEVLLGRLALACAPVELAEAEVAVGQQRADCDFVTAVRSTV
jgi:hypothetical protein